jgi:hypothetical protein
VNECAVVCDARIDDDDGGDDDVCDLGSVSGDDDERILDVESENARC